MSSKAFVTINKLDNFCVREQFRRSSSTVPVTTDYQEFEIEYDRDLYAADILN